MQSAIGHALSVRCARFRRPAFGCRLTRPASLPNRHLLPLRCVTQIDGSVGITLVLGKKLSLSTLLRFEPGLRRGVLRRPVETLRRCYHMLNGPPIAGREASSKPSFSKAQQLAFIHTLKSAPVLRILQSRAAWAEQAQQNSYIFFDFSAGIFEFEAVKAQPQRARRQSWTGKVGAKLEQTLLRV